MSLDLATALALATQCAPHVSPLTLLAVAQVESGLNPNAIGINGPIAERPRPRSRDEATRAAERLIAAGRNIDLGIGQINVRNLPWLGLSVADAFDPCRNLQAAATVLRHGYRPTGDAQAALRASLSAYNTGHPERGLRNGYVAKVLRAAQRLSGQLPVPLSAPAPASPPEGTPPDWDPFARARHAGPARFVLNLDTGAAS